MADESHYWSPPGPQQRITNRQREQLWTVRKDAHHVSCELRDDGEASGAEVQLLRDGEFYAGRRFATRDQAVGHADRVGRDLQRKGWESTPPVQ
jgi:hypothetical protein